MIPGLRVEHVSAVDSTNAALVRRARRGEPAGLVIWADRQDAGRGRQGRSWWSGPSSLTFSLLRRPPVPPSEAPRWTLLAGLAVLEALRGSAPGLWLKWPNDVQLGDRKVGGILCELEGDGLIVGVGLNLAPPPGGWPPELRERAAALPSGVGPRHEILERVLVAFLRGERELLERGPAGLMARYRAALAPMIGREVTIDGGVGRWSGTVQGVEDSGALVLLDEAGHRRSVLAGDVHLKPGTDARRPIGSRAQ